MIPDTLQLAARPGSEAELRVGQFHWNRIRRFQGVDDVLEWFQVFQQAIFYVEHFLLTFPPSTTVVWVTDGTLADDMVKNATGHYDGIYGMLQRDEADVSFLPLPLLNDDDVAVLGPVVLEDKIRFASRAILSTAQVNMVKQLFNFSPACTLAFLLTYLVLIVSIRATNHVKMSPQEITWRIYEAVLQGMSCYSKHLSSRILALWVTLGIMFLVFIWSNTITTDMVTANTDRVVYKMADIIRLRKPVFALARDPMMNKFKRSQTKMAGLYRKLRAVNINREDMMNPNSLFVEYERNGVLFSGEVLLELFVNSICAMSGYRFADNYSPVTDYGSWPWAHLMRRSADYSVLKLTRRRILLQMESHLFMKWHSNMVNMIQKMLPSIGKTEQCLIDNLDQYISDTMMTQDSANGLELQSQESVFLLCVTMLALATIALVAEFFALVLTKKKYQRKLRRLLRRLSNTPK
ncbi:hypothetical protein HDE_11605 [Halotydeus destructor]|nr:hypothetical protein HDE_11605 [Halotydeus destructor]